MLDFGVTIIVRGNIYYTLTMLGQIRRVGALSSDFLAAGSAADQHPGRFLKI